MSNLNGPSPADLAIRPAPAPNPVPPQTARTARAAADTAADRAGIVVRTLSDPDELRAVHALYRDIWRPDPDNLPVTTELLRALAKAGNYVGGAFEGDTLVGACVGFFAPPSEASLHSHIAGVDPRMRGRNVGFALKLHQRAWVLARGVSSIAWTFDPLVGRNAYFNMIKLAARPVEYLTNFYGPMADGINGDDETDRLLMHWSLQSPEVIEACDGRPARGPARATIESASVALERAADGGPLDRSTEAATVLVAVPEDIEAMRAQQPALAATWRAAVRDVLSRLLAAGYRVDGFDRTHGYLLNREVAS